MSNKQKKFRRILTFVLAVILALGALFTGAFTVGVKAADNEISFDDLINAAQCEHKNMQKKVTAPTCTKKGYTTYTCTGEGCSYSYTADEVNALGHNYADATCTKAATCTRCKATTGKSLGHNYAKATCTKAATCTRCKATTGKALGHNYAKATCTKAATCTRCKATTGKSLGHSYAAATCTKAATCTRCKATTGKALGHNYAKATCTKAATCTRCKTTSGKALGHNYAKATCTKAASCVRCSTTSGKALGHSYKTTTTTKATLRKNGKAVTSCTACGSVASTTTIKRAKSFKLSETKYSYDGKEKKPFVIVKDSAGKVLTEGIDYTVSYSSGCKKVGTYKVTIKMKGNYTGTKTLTFKIVKAKASTCTFKLSNTSYTYNGKAKSPGVTVKNAAGKTLKKGTDYTVSYARGRKNVGTYKVTIKMKGGYTGTKTLTFKIVPKAASINKLTAKSKAFTVNLNRVTTQSSGYEIQYSTSKNFSKADEKLIRNEKTSSATISRLKAKTTYYVRVRTYKTVGLKRVYSSWSSYKTIKTK